MTVILGFRDRRTEDVYNGITNARTRQLPNEILNVAKRKLDMMNATASLDDLKAPPGNRLESLKGDLAGRHSIRINSQWRIVFRWTASGPTEVEIVDYH